MVLPPVVVVVVLVVVVVVLLLVLMVVVMVVVVQEGVDPEVHAAAWLLLTMEWQGLLQRYGDAMHAWSTGMEKWHGDSWMDLEFDWAWEQVCALKKEGVVWRPIGLPPMETETEGATSSGAPGAPGAPGGTIVEDEDEEDEGPVRSTWSKGLW